MEEEGGFNHFVVPATGAEKGEGGVRLYIFWACNLP